MKLIKFFFFAEGNLSDGKASMSVEPDGRAENLGRAAATVAVMRRGWNVFRSVGRQIQLVAKTERIPRPMGDRTGDERGRSVSCARVRSVIDGNGSPTRSVIIIDLNDDDPSDSFKPLPPVVRRHSAVRWSSPDLPRDRPANQSIPSGWTYQHGCGPVVLWRQIQRERVESFFYFQKLTLEFVAVWFETFV